MRNILIFVGVVSLSLAIGSGVILSAGDSDATITKSYSNVVSLNNLDDILLHLSSQDYMEVRVAIWRMITIQDNRVSHILLTLWNGDENQSYISNPTVLNAPNVRLAIAEGLIYHSVGNRLDYADYIYKNIRNAKTIVRSNAASALGSVGDNEAVNTLAPLISNDHLIVALNAISALKKIVIENKLGKARAFDVLEHLVLNIDDASQPILKAEIKNAYNISTIALKRQKARTDSRQRISGIESNDSLKNGESLFLTGKNHSKALQLLLPHAEQGVTQAQYYVGEIYSVGVRVEHDYVKAVKWLSKAANQGNSAAQFSLASMYIAGDGVEKNYSEATKWLFQSARQGYANSQEFLGEAFQGGWWGLPQDSEKARYWFGKAESGLK